MKRYVGQWEASGRLSVWIDDSATGEERPLPLRHDLARLSETFGTTPGSKKSEQLALALLCDHLQDDEAALQRYKDFNWIVVADLPDEDWVLTPREIDEILADLEKNNVIAPEPD